MLFFEPLLVLCALPLALVLDWLLGEPKRWHPLVGFGFIANRLERCLNNFQADGQAPPVGGLRRVAGVSEFRQRAVGAAAWCLLVLMPSAMLYWCFSQLPPGTSMVSVDAQSWHFGDLFSFSGLLCLFVFSFILYFTVALKSLVQHVDDVRDALCRGDTEGARVKLQRVVSRTTQDMSPSQLARGSIETMLENYSDAVLAPIFWFVFLGPVGAIAYRLANTLDAMWGYKTPRFRSFGFVSARMDDLLNYIPARICALFFMVFGYHCISERRKKHGGAMRGVHAWRYDSKYLASPNGGVVMSVGAGVLGVKLGGPAVYHGELLDKPWFGGEGRADTDDISCAICLGVTCSFAIAVVCILSICFLLGI